MSTCFDDLLGTNNKFATLLDLLNYRVQQQSDQTAYTFIQKGEEIGKISYQELEQKAKAIATSLQSLDLAGERALLLYPPGLEFVNAFFGCLYAGVVAVPAYPPRRNQNMSRLKALVTEAKAKVALTTESLLGNVKSRFVQNSEFPKLHWLATDNIADQKSQSWSMPGLTSNNLAFFQYTSGSTGNPKGVMITHGNLLHNERMIAQAFGHTKDTIVVGWLPLFHDMGLIGNVLQPLYLGQPCFLMSPVDFLQKPFRWLQAISHYKATTSGGPNFAYDLCVRKIKPEDLASLDLSSWDVAFTGAEPVRAATLEQFAEKFKVCGFRREAFYPCYGMAETTLFVTGGLKDASPAIHQVSGTALEQNQIVTATSSESNVRQIVGCGQTRLDMNIVIADPESLTCCEGDRVGEIWVSGSSVAQGYWNRPQETEQTFNAYLADTKEGPFLRTGDLGFVRDNELFVTGRLKDVIIIRGQNYYPQDIEQTVEESHPALRPGCSAAFTVEVKGSERLVIVQEVERSYLRKLNINQIVDCFCQAVAAEQGLQVYAAVLVKPGSIPKTSSGKIQRHACRAKFLSGELNLIKDWSENPQYKSEFVQLQAEIDLVLQKLATSKQTSRLS
ncbi:MAG: fatty acyl-AMP ligase [Pleurocapsa sp. MO_226.B13]|nr:fatty acyl-AMP ligase [Pleurocapsa sp. MO_226.B13]